MGQDRQAVQSGHHHRELPSLGAAPPLPDRHVYDVRVSLLSSDSQAELAQSSDLVRREEYLSAPEPQSISVLSLLARPFWWTLSTVLGSASSTSIDYGEAADQKEWAKRQGEYVVPDLVEVSGPFTVLDTVPRQKPSMA